MLTFEWKRVHRLLKIMFEEPDRQTHRGTQKYQRDGLDSAWTTKSIWNNKRVGSPFRFVILRHSWWCSFQKHKYISLLSQTENENLAFYGCIRIHRLVFIPPLTLRKIVLNFYTMAVSGPHWEAGPREADLVWDEEASEKKTSDEPASQGSTRGQPGS